MAYFDAPYRPADLTLDSSHSLVANMVAWFPLTQGSGSVAQCILHPSHTGTLGSGVTWETSERGTVAVFDGTSNAKINFSSQLVSGQTLSFSVWLYVASSVAGRRTIYCDGQSFVQNDFRYDGNGKRFVFDHYTPSGEPNKTNTDYGIDDRWIHVVVTQDSSTTKIYYDGILKHSGTAETYASAAPTAFNIGSRDGSDSFDGKMQNFQAWDRVISADEVALLHARPWTASNFDTEALWLSPPASPTLSTASEATALMSSCVGWWPLTEGSNTTATDLVGSNNGTITNGAWATETVGTVADLGTTSNVSGTGVNVSTAVTFSLWYKEAGSTASGPVFISLPRSTGGSNGMELQHRGNGVRLGVYTSSGSRVTATSSAVNIGDGEWHHIVGTYDGSNIRLYVDGVERASAAQTGTVSHLANGEFNINALSSGTSGFSCDGIYQNVRIWDRALSSSEVAILAERPWIGAAYNESDPLYPPVPSSLTPLDSANSILTDLELWLPLTDGSGTTAVDISTTGDNFTATGTPTWVNSKLGTAVELVSNTTYLTSSVYGTTYSANTPITISVWVKSSNSATNALLQYGDTAVDGQPLYALQNNSGQLRWYSRGQLSTGVSVEDNTWHHAVITNDGTSNRYYFDGVLSETVTSTSTTGESVSNKFWVGAGYRYNNTNEFRNVRVWSRALSASEVADIFYSPWLGSAYPSTSTGAPRFLINGLRPLLVNGGLVR